MDAITDVYLIECKQCGNRHWISIGEKWLREDQLRRSLRCRCKAGGSDLDIGRIALPYELGFEAILYEGWPGKGPYQVLARCNSNTYGHVLFDWISKQYPTKRYVLSADGRTLKDTGERGE